MNAAVPSELFRQAAALHQSGRLAEAEALYHETLRNDPVHVDALHMLGVIALQNGRFDDALRWIDAALRIRPDLAAAHCNRGNALRRLRRPQEALASYDRALALAPADAESHANRGNLLMGLQRPAEALASYDRALALAPRHVLALNNRGNALQALGRLEEAVASYDRVLALDPAHVPALNNRGNALRSLGRLGEALVDCERALALTPGDPELHASRGNLLMGLQRPAEALASYDRALALAPRHVLALNNRGNALQALGRLEEAAASYGRVLALEPAHVLALNNRGNTLRSLGRQTEALAEIDRALALDPRFAEAHNNRGSVLKELRRPVEALAAFEQALALRADFAEAHNNRGLVLHGLRRHEEALLSIERALASRPDYAEAHNNRGAVLQDLNRIPEALASYDRALALAPDYAEAFINRGVALYYSRRPQEALASYRRALELRPDSADAHTNQALCHLQLGDYTRGWSDYEWRWRKSEAEARRPYGQPVWLGREEIRGRTVLLTAEQGLGDTLQFCRFAPQVAARGARVVLEVQAPLKRLLGRLEGVSGVIARGEPAPAFDYQCPLLSLPLALGVEREEAIPREPYLRPGAEARRRWGERVGPKRGLTVGLVWSGYAGFRNDRNRSVPLAMLLPLLESGARVISLQKEVREGDRATLWAHPEIERLGEEVEDFEDTAGLLEHLDVVISVDTAVAHLAGGMGKPVWVLLPYASDWRWGLDRTDSPWYPGARLYRQSAAGDWAGVVRAVVADLRGPG